MFSSPYYPGHYPPNINCTWNIEVGARVGGVREKRERGQRGRSWRERDTPDGRGEGDECLGHALGSEGQGTFCSADQQHLADSGLDHCSWPVLGKEPGPGTCFSGCSSLKGAAGMRSQPLKPRGCTCSMAGRRRSLAGGTAPHTIQLIMLGELSSFFLNHVLVCRTVQESRRASKHRVRIRPATSLLLLPADWWGELGSCCLTLPLPPTPPGWEKRQAGQRSSSISLRRCPATKM